MALQSLVSSTVAFPETSYIRHYPNRTRLHLRLDHSFCQPLGAPDEKIASPPARYPNPRFRLSLASLERTLRSCAFTYSTFPNSSSAIHWELVLFNTALQMLSLDGRPSSTLSSLGGNYTNINTDRQMRAALQQAHQLHHCHMWIITGPAGCGKSSVAEYLAKELSLPYIEGDDVSIRTD